MERSLVAEHCINQELTDKVNSGGSNPSVPIGQAHAHIIITPITSQEGIWQQSGVFLYAIFLQRVRHQRKYVSIRRICVNTSFWRQQSAVAYGAGRTVIYIY